jgi:hypothetical protein
MKTGSILAAGGFLTRKLALPEIELRIASAECENRVGQARSLIEARRNSDQNRAVIAALDGPGIGKQIGGIGYHPACQWVRFVAGWAGLRRRGTEKQAQVRAGIVSENGEQF